MTDNAVKRVKKLKKMRQTSDAFFRVKITTGGCSGLSYVFDLVQESQDDDLIFVFGDTKVCVDKKSYLFLNGMEIDYEETPFKSGIKLNVPSVDRTCGCGESVSF